jgi:membrane protein
VWPEKETARARMELVRRLRLKAMLPRFRRDDDEHQRFPEVAAEDEETVVLQAYDETQAGVDTEGLAPRRRA